MPLARGCPRKRSFNSCPDQAGGYHGAGQKQVAIIWYDSLMDGVHDIGGMDGFGKIEVEKNEPVFHAEWEGRVLAMQRAMSYAGAWCIDHSRFAKERLPPITYLSASYYQRW